MMIALDIGMIGTLLVTGAITIWWKISMHAAVAAGTVIVLVLVYGPVLGITALAAVAVAWSRVVLGDHTTAQVTIGALVGALTIGGACTLLL